MAMPASAVCVGDNCVDFYLPPINHRYIGGNAANAAAHVQRQGIPTAYVGVVGDDADGDLAIRKLSEQGVDTSYVKILPGQTATTHIQLTGSNERQFVYEYLGPQPILELDEPTLQFICERRLIHNTMLGGTEAYLPRFRKDGRAIISLDYGERSHPDFIARTIRFVDWAFFSMATDDRPEAEALARSMFSKGPSLVVVTLGVGGSVSYDGSMYDQPAIPVNVVDTTGAGDTYIGAFLAQRLAGYDVPVCMQTASQVAAQTCTHYGGWEQAENVRVANNPPAAIP
jgi:fructoselysine 6-kinase